jgi:hypothetical protein
MTESCANPAGSSRVPSAGREAGRGIPVVVLGLSLSAFFAVSYVLCVLGYLLFPNLPVEHDALAIFLPGFTLLSWQSYFLGLVESFIWGWYVALMFGVLYNFFVRRAS